MKNKVNSENTQAIAIEKKTKKNKLTRHLIFKDKPIEWKDVKYLLNNNPKYNNRCIIIH